jgi:ferritin-like metal-binding protein YciE
MKLETLKNLLTYELQDIYSAEQQITEALPKMAKAASNDKLKKGFEKHLEQTKEHIECLEKIRDILKIEIEGVTCRGMEGLLKEGSELLHKDPSPLLDHALISAAQRVEHYEIAAYGCSKTYANLLGETDVEELLDATAQEEEVTDKKLGDIAMNELDVNTQE